MPRRVGRELNDTIGTVLLASEINTANKPILGITFDLDYGQQFDFRGITAEINATETSAPPGVFQFFVRGVENDQITPTDSFESAFNRQGKVFYQAQAHLDLGQRYFKVQDLFPFQNPRVNVGSYSFFTGILTPAGLFVNSIFMTLTVYGSVSSAGEGKKFPYDFR